MRKPFFFTISGLSFSHQKSINKLCFFKAASWIFFFFSKMVDFRTPFEIRWGQKWQQNHPSGVKMAGAHSRVGVFFVPGTACSQDRFWSAPGFNFGWFWMKFGWYFDISLNSEQPQRTINSWRKSSEISTANLHGQNSPLSKTPAAATNACTETPSYKMGGGGARAAWRIRIRRPPLGVQTRRVEPNFGFCRSPNSQTPKASKGPTSAADPVHYLRADVFLTASASFFHMFFIFCSLKRSSKIGPLSNPPKISKIGPLGAQS